MTDYRRNYIPGGSYFFTVNLLNRKQTLLTDHIDELRESFRTVKKELPFTIDAIVILPEHLHCIWTLPESSADYSKRWQRIKSLFTRMVNIESAVSKSRTRKGEKGVWQRRFWEHTIRDQNDYNRHFDYIHFNPVKHGYVECVRDWEYSSFHHYVRDGLLPIEWYGSDDDLIVGEREILHRG